jgi:hypothetical protein
MRELSLEHVPQRALRGKAIILTCTACNNFAGSAYEPDAPLRERHRRQVGGVLGQEDGDLGRFIIEAGGATANVSVKRDGAVVAIEVLDGQNSPTAIKALREVFAGLADGSEFTLTPRAKYRPKHAAQADLKAAFLLSVAKFGYSFALNARLERVRRQLLNPDEDHFEVRYILQCDIPERTIVVCDQEALIALRVGRHVVTLPWVLGPEDKFDQVSRGRISSLRGHQLPFPASFEAVLDRDLSRRPRDKARD